MARGRASSGGNAAGAKSTYGKKSSVPTGKPQQNIKRPLPKDWVFALDIGTRSVIGIVGQQQGDSFILKGMEMMEHPSRAMIDGQIENIAQVAAVALQVKQNLEKRLHMSLPYVNVAAAGRALKTGKATFTMDVNTGLPVTARDMYELEVGAIALAREQVQQTAEAEGRFYCVGHSVVRYYLDDYPFSTILGHKGNVAQAEVIATFLPTEVVDSLCAAMKEIGCEINHLTLEPIAAMNAVIPQDLRLLNLALVDIGAGTSDIAISENGTVAAYTMATVAGDEVTEEIIKIFLVDFHTGERMKHEAARGEPQISYTDILGLENTVSLEEVLQAMEPAVESLAEEICGRITETNGKAPVAVFLVGGGSLAPGLSQKVAAKLGLDERRVAVGGENYLKHVEGDKSSVSGPAFATPIGIALTASTAGSAKGLFVYVNGEQVRLFRNDRMSVMDVLLSAGYQYKDLMGQSGKSITYRLNGQKCVKRGGHFTPAEILLNGQAASITTPVNCEDKIQLTPAVCGRDASLTLTELGLDPCAFTVMYESTPVQAGRFVTINGKEAVSGQSVSESDEILSTEVLTMNSFCRLIGLTFEEGAFTCNGDFVGESAPIKANDVIRPVPEELRPRWTEELQVPQEHAQEENVSRETETETAEPSLTWTAEQSEDVAEEPFEAEEEPVKEAISTAGVPLPPPPPGKRRALPGEPLRIRLNGEARQLPPKADGFYYQFLDLLSLMDIDMKNVTGAIVLRLNGQEPSYLDELFMDDDAEIRVE